MIMMKPGVENGNRYLYVTEHINFINDCSIHSDWRWAIINLTDTWALLI